MSHLPCEAIQAVPAHRPRHGRKECFQRKDDVPAGDNWPGTHTSSPAVWPCARCLFHRWQHCLRGRRSLATRRKRMVQRGTRADRLRQGQRAQQSTWPEAGGQATLGLSKKNACNPFQNSGTIRPCPHQGWGQDAEPARSFRGQTNFGPEDIRPPAVVVFLKCHDHPPASCGMTLSTNRSDEFRYSL